MGRESERKRKRGRYKVCQLMMVVVILSKQSQPRLFVLCTVRFSSCQLVFLFYPTTVPLSVYDLQLSVFNFSV